MFSDASPWRTVGWRRESHLAVRIYSLAKELKLDSKVLVDICTSAGVTGKGSALASLTDEEVERVAPIMQRRCRKKFGGSRIVPLRRHVERSAGAAGRASRGLLAPGRRGRQGSVLDKTDRRKRQSANGPSAPSKPLPPTNRQLPSIKLAPLPSVQQPAAEPKSHEPAPQKPDLKLPVDALRASSKAGSKPLSEHFASTR